MSAGFQISTTATCSSGMGDSYLQGGKLEH